MSPEHQEVKGTDFQSLLSRALKIEELDEMQKRCASHFGGGGATLGLGEFLMREL